MSPHVHFEQRPWGFPVSLTLALLLAAALYLHGWISARSASAGAIPAWKASNFFLGLALVWTAWGSPLAAYDHSLLTVHMVKHLLLMTFAPPLILVGEPMRVFWDGMPLFARNAFGHIAKRALVEQFARIVTSLALCWTVSALTLIAWHVPAMFELGMRSEIGHTVEQAMFLRSGSTKCSKKLGGCLKMETEPILATLDAAEVQRRHGIARSSVLSDYWSLTKPEVNFLIAVTTAAGFWMGAPASFAHFPWTSLLHTLIGTVLVASGAATLNQLIELRFDGQMRRTARRPLVSGRIQPAHALWLGISLSVIGTIYLAVTTNALASFLSILTLLGYLFLYTPLKRKTPLCTLIGALPGATPPLIGWAAACGHLDGNAWLLFAIVFLWQFPHFMAIAWMYREDYARAGYVVLPAGKSKDHFVAWQTSLPSLALLAVALGPAIRGESGIVYLAGALVLGRLSLLQRTLCFSNVYRFCAALAFCFHPLSSVVACFPRVGQEMNMKGMPRTMLVRIRFPRLFLALLLLSFVHLPASNAQNVEPFKFFRDHVGLKDDQITAIRTSFPISTVSLWRRATSSN